MAFLCPSRRSRQKKKKKESAEPYLGRITGSASVDTLVRVGLEKQHGLSPESRMTVLDDFSACAEDELNVERGQTVYMLYTEQEWMYVLKENGQEGFIPRSFAKPCRSPAMRKRVPPTPLSQLHGIPPPVGGTDDDGNDGDESNSPTNSSSQVAGFPHDASLPEDDLQPASAASDQDVVPASPSSDHLQPSSLPSEEEGEASADAELPEILPFHKRAQGNWVALFPHDVQQESDVRVMSGEVVTVLNADDAEWYWVRRSGGAEGFVPKIILCKLPDDFRINNKLAAGLISQAVQKAGGGHHRSRSMTEQLTALPAYLKPPPHRPPSSNPSIFPGGTSAASPFLGRPPPSSTTPSGRQRPHSSIGCPVTSSWSQSPASASLAVSGPSLASSQPANQRPQSAIGYQITSPQSQSHVPVASLPAVSSVHLPRSSQPAVQRPHSSMGLPMTSSQSQGQMPLSSDTISSRPPSASAVSRVPPSSFPANHQLSSNHVVPPSVRDKGSAAQNVTQAATTANRVLPLSQRPPPAPSPSAAGLQHSASSVLSSPTQSLLHSSSANHATPPSYSASHVPPSSYSTNHSPLTSSKVQPHSPPASQNPPPSITTTNRFTSAQSRQSNPTRLTSSLNQSQNGSRTLVMHQNSAPELIQHQSQYPGKPVHQRRSSHEPYVSKNDAEPRDSLKPKPASPRSHPGFEGQTKSLPPFPTSFVPGHVTELMTLHKFSSKGADDISVCSEEVVYSDLNQQPERDWLWVYSPRLGRHGYIPRNNVRVPASVGQLRNESVARV